MKVQEVTYQKLSFPKWDIVYHQMPGDEEDTSGGNTDEPEDDK